MPRNAHLLSSHACHKSVSACLHSRPINRSFSSLPARCQIGPESPKFIEVPRPLQPQAVPKPLVKGILPVPRQIFPRGGRDKSSPEYLAAVTPEPLAKKPLPPKDQATVEYVQWKARQATNRRRNLREGLVELHHRKQRSDRQRDIRSAYKQAEHARLVSQPIREDERLTNPTIVQSMKMLHLGSATVADYETWAAEKSATIEAKDIERKEERRSAIHELYMHARSFIVTEDQLNQEIDDVFDKETFTSDNSAGHSIWNTGEPETVQQMLNRERGLGTTAMDQQSGPGKLIARREQRLAEELTGGKIE